MKTILKTFPAGIVLILAVLSCSAPRHVIKSARTAELECRIMTMPTVAELEVEQTAASADTTWEKRIFDNSISKKAQTDNLVASLLRAYNADILLEPKVEHSMDGNVFSATHKLKVSGYPARYGKFRTATTEDIEVINKATKKPVASNIVIANGYRMKYPGLSAADAQNLEIAKAVKKKPKYERRKGYRMEIGTGYNFEMDDDATFVFDLYTVQGYQFNPYLFLGAGFGYTYEDYHSSYTDGYHYLDYFANLKAYMSKRAVAPFFDLRLGGTSEIGEDTGFYAGIGLGLAFACFELSFKYCWNSLAEIDMLGFSLAFSF